MVLSFKSFVLDSSKCFCTARETALVLRVIFVYATNRARRVTWDSVTFCEDQSKTDRLIFTYVKAAVIYVNVHYSSGSQPVVHGKLISGRRRKS